MRLIDVDRECDRLDDMYTLGDIGRRERDDLTTYMLEVAMPVEAIPVEWIEAKRDELANKLDEVAGVLDHEELADAYCHHLKSINNLLDEWEEKNE